MPQIKVALVHDYLNQYGGAEKVLEAFAELFPDAPIYTLLYDERRTRGRFAGRVAGTSFLDTPFVRRHHRPFIPLMPFAAAQINLKDRYDLILSSSAGFSKGISYVNTPHISYCHTPLRYAWEPRTYFKNYLSRPLRLAALPVLHYLRSWDRRMGRRADLLIANSHFIAEKIRVSYGRQPLVIHPPVDRAVFHPKPLAPEKSYFLAVGRLMHYKRFDLIVRAFNELQLPLRIAGIGPELDRLRALNTSPYTRFLGFVPRDEELCDLYNGARALIFPQVEDFGLVAAEAIACGTPVIAYAEGGATEIVNERTGIFFDKQTEPALINAVRLFSKCYFSPAIVADTAARFSKERFLERIRAVIAKELPRFQEA